MESAHSRTAVKPLDVQAAAGLAAAGDRWSVMLKVMALEYPYCTMQGVHIEDGAIVACEGIQQSFVFGAVDAPPEEPSFDGHWQALRALCAKLGSGRLAEIRFSRGRPVSARMNEGGRRFRRLVVKTPRDKERSPMC